MMAQGIFRFSLIFSWSVLECVEYATLRPSIRNVDSVLEQVVSVILICRFTLELRRMNAHPHGTGEPSTLDSLEFVNESLHDSVIEQFGDCAPWRYSQTDSESIPFEEDGFEMNIIQRRN